MLTVLRTASLRAVPMIARAPVAQAAVARYATSHRWKSAYAVDAPDGTHDDQDLVRHYVVVYVLWNLYVSFPFNF